MTDTKHKEHITSEHFGIPADFADRAENYAQWRMQALMAQLAEAQELKDAQVAQQAEQAGWVRVPVELTPEMVNAGRTTPMPSDSEWDEDDDYRAVYKAMLAAAPKGVV